LARQEIYYLLKGPQNKDKYSHQNRVTKYFDKIRDLPNPLWEMRLLMKKSQLTTSILT
jgi:hypothetical protein